jgi:hypothetical protein
MNMYFSDQKIYSQVKRCSLPICVNSGGLNYKFSTGIYPWDLIRKMIEITEQANWNFSLELTNSSVNNFDLLVTKEKCKSRTT